MTTYDNLHIAQTTLIYDSNNNSSVASGTFDLSTMAFLPNVPLIDQIEVERVFDTGADTNFGTNVFTIADRRQLFIFPKNWYTINEQTKVLTFIDLSTILVGSSYNPFKFYPESRSFSLTLKDANGNDQYVDIPLLQANTTSGPPVRQYDKVFIRRKTVSLNSIVTFAPGTRLTTTQLNLQFDQLKYLVQEVVAKIRNEIILKYDENAVDGPFLGNGDLKMNNNFIKDVGSKEITDTGTFFTGQDNIAYSGGTFIANVLAVKNAVTKGAIYRTGLVAGTPTFTGDFTTRLPGVATDYKITNLSPGTAATDAVNLSQLNNADNLTSGTVAIARLPNAIPLSKLSSAIGQTYTFPLENLPSTLTTSVGTFGQLTASNTNNMVSATVNSKGILSSLTHRNMTVDDLPVVSGLVAQSYGGTGKLLTVAADTKGRITSISTATITTSDLPNTAVTAGSYGAISGVSANALTRFTVDAKGNLTAAANRSIEVNDLPTTSVTGAGTYGQATASNTNNMLQVAYDNKGRVTTTSHRNMGIDDLPGSIPLSKLSNALSQSYILPKDAIADGSILVAKLDTVTAGQSALPVSFIPSGIILSKIDPATPGAFVLPDTCLNTIATITAGAYSTQPVKDITVDTKGRITAISQRAITSGDIPALSASAISITTSPFADALIPPLATSSAGSYGSTTTIPTFTVDTKGRVTVAANSVAISTAHISNFSTNTNTLIDARALSLGVGAFFNAGTKLISNVLNPVSDQDAATKKYVVDNFQSLSGFNAAALTQIQANAPFWDSVNSRFTALRSSVAQNIFGVATPTVDSHAANKLYVDTALASYTTTATLNTPIDARLATNSVFLSGAVLSAGTKRITAVVDPTSAQDAATKNYVDTNYTLTSAINTPIDARLATNSVFLSAGSLSAGTKKIINVVDPTLAQDAATKNYVDTNYTLTSGLNTTIDNRLATNSVFLSGGALSAGTKKIINVVNPTAAQDVVTKSYLEANAIFATGSNLSAGNKYLTDMIMRPAGSLAANDAVNFGYVETAVLNAGGSIVGTATPQVFKQTWASATAIASTTPATTSFIRYRFNFVDPTNPIYATSSAMILIDAEGGTRVFTPNALDATAGTVYDGYFFLDTSGGATKVLNVYVSATPTGSITIRNFGLSRVVSGGLATTSSTGLVSIASGNDGGISVTGLGDLALIPATATQLGAVKLGTGLAAGSGGIVNVTYPTAGTATLGQVMVALVATSGLSLNTSTGALSLPIGTASQLGGLKLGTGLAAGSGGIVNVTYPTAGNATLGQVMVDAVATSGLSLNTSTGALSLPAATTTQLGGIKQGTGLTITAGVAAVNLTDTVNTTSSTTAASATSVNTLRLASMLIDGTIQMTGKLRTATATTAIASLSIPPSAATLGTLVNGDLWNLNDVLQFRTTSATKQIAYRDAATTGALGLVQISTGNDSGLSINGSGVLSVVPATSTVLGGIKQGTGLTITSGVAAVNLSSSLASTLTDTAATSSAIKTVNDYAVATNSALVTATARVTTLESTTVPAVATTANNALARAGGTMTGMIQLPGSTTSLAPIRFVGGSAPTSPTAGDLWWESNTLKLRVGAATKDLAFTDSPLTGNAATATQLATTRAIALTGDVTGTVNFDGSAAVSIATTIAANSVALGTDTTGNYVATATGSDGVAVTGSGSEGAGISITNTDKGSSQAIFKTITPSSGTSVTAATNSSTLNLTAGSGITVTGSGSTITITNSAVAPNIFGTIAVAGQSNVVVDTTTDTLTLAAGTGMSITTDATTDTVTFNNTGVTSVTGTANQVTVTGTTTPTLSLPQNIHTAATPTFAGATLGSVIITSAAANTLTTTGNLDLILDPAGTGKISLLANVDCSTNTLTAGASTLGTLSCDAITFKTTGTKLKLGTTDSTLEAISTASAGTYAVGDLVLRAPVSGKAFLVYSPSTAPTLADAIITKSAMDTAISTATSGFMTLTGGNAGANSQTFGSSLGNFSVTGFAGATNFEILNSGSASFAKQVTIYQGGLAVNSGGISVSGASAIGGSLTVTTAAITAATAPTTGNHLTNKTYVDGAIDSISDTNASLPIKKLLMQVPIRQYVIGAITLAAAAVITTSGMTVNVPKYFPIFHSSGGARNTSLTVLEGHQIIILEQKLTAGSTTFAYTKSALFATVDPIATMLAYRIDSNSMTTTGTFTRVSVGSVLTGGVGGTTFTLNNGGGATIEYVLMRIA
jgi:hypothetical protein